MPMRLDYTNMMGPPIAGGITDAEWRRYFEAIASGDTRSTANQVHSSGGANNHMLTIRAAAVPIAAASVACVVSRKMSSATMPMRIGIRMRKAIGSKVSIRVGDVRK